MKQKKKDIQKIQINNIVNKHIKKAKNSTKFKKEEILNMELLNVDFDKADEALLRAKKKKLDDAFKKVDKEELLFAEIEFSDQEGEVKETLPVRKVKNKTLKSLSPTDRSKDKKNQNDSFTEEREKIQVNKKENVKRPKKLVLHENTAQRKKMKIANTLDNNKLSGKANKILAMPEQPFTDGISQSNNQHIEKEKKDKFKSKKQLLKDILDKKELYENVNESKQNQKSSKESNSRLSIDDLCTINAKEKFSKKGESAMVSSNTNKDAIADSNKTRRGTNKNYSHNISNSHDAHVKEKLEKIIKKNTRRRPLSVDGSELRQRMMERVKAAKFRLLNETLYTSSGTEAKKLFQNSPEAFEAYHEGFRQQVKKWPINPLTQIIKKIKAMPKSHIIADMGCGDATLSQSVPHKVHSFDLVATSPAVVACDIAKTPLGTHEVNVVVFCLALMGTELEKYFAEANRVLKTKGKLLIAEVESRFEDVNLFVSNVEKLGFKLNKIDQSHNVFLFMEFTKVADCPHRKPQITLRPCLYKRR